ncbi:hypothetical protein ZIOFF_031487 [Zingiber officinale]|uniref:Uncharacterized protein n=1 Tax=Zingiber officinale TaxID=94328 RepID=A0A8J5GTR5_ZINOF|nr:hypothetical protein ZIOFF_031487 [Zingiber officinale]
MREGRRWTNSQEVTTAVDYSKSEEEEEDVLDQLLQKEKSLADVLDQSNEDMVRRNGRGTAGTGVPARERLTSFQSSACIVLTALLLFEMEDEGRRHRRSSAWPDRAAHRVWKLCGDCLTYLVEIPLVGVKTKTFECWCIDTTVSLSFKELLLVASVCYLERIGFSIAYTAAIDSIGVNQSSKGLILSVFYYGYVVSQVPGDAGKVNMMVVARFLVDVAQGFIFPSIHTILAQWVPPHERSRSVSLTTSGMYLGAAGGMLVLPSLVKYKGPQSVFIVESALGIMWSFLWFRFSSDPVRSEHPKAAAAGFGEHNLPVSREKKIPSAGNLRRFTKIPWKKIIFNLPIWTIVVNNFTFHYALYVLMNWLPTYFELGLQLSLQDMGSSKMIPCFNMFIFSNTGGILADHLITRRFLSVTKTRKLLNTIGFVIAALALMAIPLFRNPSWTVKCSSISLGFLALGRAGFAVNHMDVAPRYAGVVMGVSNTAGTLAGIVGVELTGRILEAAKSADMDLTSIECFGLKLLSCTKIQDIKHAVLAAVIKAGAAREHKILAEIRDAIFSFIRKIEPKKVMDTLLVSRVRILYIRSLLARSPELQLIKVSSVERFLEKANDGHSRCSSRGSSPSRSLVHYDSVHGFKLREIIEEAKAFAIGNEALAALFVHTPAGELQCQIRSWLAENYDFLSVVGADSISGNSTSQLELLSTAIMDGWMAGLGTAQFPSTDALGQLLSEYTKRVYSSQLQHLKVVGLINLSRHGEPDDSEGVIRPGGPIGIAGPNGPDRHVGLHVLDGVLAAVIKVGAAREHEILAEIRDAVFSFIRKIEPKKVMDTMLVSRVRILYIRSLLARSPELQLIKVSSVERFLEKTNDGHSRCSSRGSSPSRSLVHYDSVHGFKLREITEEAKAFVIGNEALAALFVHSELQCQIRSWLAENYDFLSVVGADSISGNSTSQLELLSTIIMDGWMAGLGTAQFPSTDALGQLLSEYTKRVYSSQLQHLKVVGLINLSRHGEPDDSEGAIRPGGPIGIARLNGPDRHVGLHVLDGVRLSRLNNLGGSSVLYGLGVTSTEWAEQVGEGKGQVRLDGLFNLKMHINWPVCLVWEAGWINHTELGKSFDPDGTNQNECDFSRYFPIVSA